MGREKAANDRRPPRERTIVDAGVLSGRSWWLYSDGTFEGETGLGMQRFRDFEDFKSATGSSPALRTASVSKQQHLDAFRSRLTQSEEPATPHQSQGPDNPAATEATAPRQPLAPRIIARTLAGVLALAICFTGWIVLSRHIRFEEAKRQEHAKKLEQEQAKAPRPGADATSAIDGLQGITLSDWNWRAEGYVPIMFASFAVRNNNAFDVKDVEISCSLFDNTGTVVDRNVKIIDDVIKARSSRAFENFDMGFLHYGGNFSVPVPITSSNCEISNFARAE